MIDKRVGKRIKQRREQLGLTQEQFAEKLGVVTHSLEYKSYMLLDKMRDLPPEEQNRILETLDFLVQQSIKMRKTVP